ncbi:MAG: TIGR00730 family Rossman fold protein [Planctomycetes bacterium]|nr:TIGR00730 family Rossman fold protein [Planctomycetota bacterium]
MRRVCVYCASSPHCHSAYLEAAHAFGQLLAREGIGVVYGGGGVGLMGALADGALREGGEVIGVIPRFMMEREWGHAHVTELRVVNDMHVRKQTMIHESDALVALPGGCGTLEELLEAITWKRLGLHEKPIVIANLRGFYDPTIRQLEACIEERFMTEAHATLWCSVQAIDSILPALRDDG